MERDSRKQIRKIRDGEVDVAIEQFSVQDVVGIFDKLHLDERISLLEFQDDVGQDGAPTRVGDSDAQDAALVLRDVGKFLLHLGAFLAEGHRITQQHLTGVGEVEGNVAHDELTSQFTLHFRHVGTQRLLCDVELFGCAGEITFTGEYFEVFQRCEIHCLTPITVLTCNSYEL